MDPVVGRVVGLHGLRGELKIDASRVGLDVFAVGITLAATLGAGDPRDVTVTELRWNKGRPLIRLAGVDDANAAEALVGATLRISRDAVKLAEGEYFDDDLVGCTLVDEQGRAIARVDAVEHYPAQDMLRTRGGLVPLVRAFVQAVDVDARRITVTLPPGLLEGEAAEA